MRYKSDLEDILVECLVRWTHVPYNTEELRYAAVLTRKGLVANAGEGAIVLTKSGLYYLIENMGVSPETIRSIRLWLLGPNIVTTG